MPAGGFRLIFTDPPYGKKEHGILLREIGEREFLHQDGIAVAEDRTGEELPDRIGTLTLFDRRRYGDTGFWFYRHHKEGLP